MREEAPFRYDDLEDLNGRLLSRAERVVPMHDVFKGDTGDRVIGMRHDVDDNEGSLESAVRMAEWEFEHGYSATYYFLHGSYYWDELLDIAPQFEELGHEVGIHCNAIAEGLRQKKDPHRVFGAALHELRATGVRVVGSAAHGDPWCRNGDGRVVFTNDEIFSECPRPQFGEPVRMISRGGVRFQLKPISRSVYGLEYDAAWLRRGDYISDSGGRWNPRPDSFELVVEHWSEAGQLHVLTHPDWWSQAFVPSEVVV